MKWRELAERRLKLLTSLNAIYDTTYQAQNANRWTKKFDFITLQKYRKYAPAIHYEALPNEIVMDIDTPDADNFIECVNYLSDLDIPFTGGYSGSKGFHVHTLITPKNVSMRDFLECVDVSTFTRILNSLIIKDMAEQNIYGCNQNDRITDILMESEKREKDVTSDIDPAQSRHRKIRSFFSIHPKTGLIKMPFWELPVERVYTVDTSRLIEVRETYPTWELSKLWYRIVKKKWREISDKERDWKSFEPVDSPKSSCKWVKEVLDNPQDYGDGRRRLLLYVLPQYLINVKGMDYEDAVEELRKWIDGTKRGDDNNLLSLAKSQLRSCQRTKVFPSRKEFEAIQVR